MEKFTFLHIILYLCCCCLASDDIHEYIVKKSINPKHIPLSRTSPEKERDPLFWRKSAQDRIGELIKQRPIERRAKNVLIFVGDGMSIATLMAARTLKGQLNGAPGEESQLFFENFPYSGLAKTFCTDAQVAESACAATAIFSGIKNNFFTLGVSANVEFGNCSAENDPNNRVDSILNWAQRGGKATGFVTNSPVTDSTPAATYAHTSNRLWQADTDVIDYTQNPEVCIDIARQLVEQSPGKDLNVIMGGGRKYFLPNSIRDEYDFFGYRSDERNLVNSWKENNPNGVYVSNRNDLRNVDSKSVNNLLGLFNPNKFAYNSLSDVNQPKLWEMTEKAIEILQKNRNGFFLLVENDNIDDAHHETFAKAALDETLELEKAIEVAARMTEIKDTLIVVTSDHGHTMSISSYPRRGNDIVGINDVEFASDLLPMSVLSYTNGPNQYRELDGSRTDLTNILGERFDVEYPAHLKTPAENHGGEDVAVFARGPYAHYFTGSYSQHDIAHLMAFASCLGTNRTHCRKFG